ncbi:MAG: hypothetical protein DHS20C02_10080 [Micavibrio sp.]|nr:MAG: hypothetical protein DHS20C02_10080 [Micavibrio sp.]
MSTNPPSATARFIKPPNILKQKVGVGGIDESLLDQSQEYIENTDLDFAPIAQQFLKEFSSYIKKARTAKGEINKEKLVRPIMQLKANGGMFRYQLLTDVADICLQFLEGIEGLNKDAIEVLAAHEKTLELIILHQLKGDGGGEGYALVKELDKACKRYFKKHKKA